MSTSTSSATTGGAVADGPAPGPDPGAPARGGAVKTYLSSRYRQAILVGSFFVMILFFVLQEPDTYPTTGNIENLINGMPVLAVMAIAVTVVLVLGEFDLSVPNVAALTALIVGILVSQSSLGLILALLLGLLVAATAGTVNGVAVGYAQGPGVRRHPGGGLGRRRPRVARAEQDQPGADLDRPRGDPRGVAEAHDRAHLRVRACGASS